MTRAEIGTSPWDLKGKSWIFSVILASLR
jgi:hypothetical protein